MMNEYGELLKKTAGMRKRLREKVIDGDFTIEDAVRVYLWSKAGFEIPGLSETDRLALVDIVEKDEQLLAFALSVGKISREKAGYLEPNKEWELEGIKFDLFQKSSKVKRAEFLQDFKNNREIIFISILRCFEKSYIKTCATSFASFRFPFLSLSSSKPISCIIVVINEWNLMFFCKF